MRTMHKFHADTVQAQIRLYDERLKKNIERLRNEITDIERFDYSTGHTLGAIALETVEIIAKLRTLKDEAELLEHVEANYQLGYKIINHFEELSEVEQGQKLYAIGTDNFWVRSDRQGSDGPRWNGSGGAYTFDEDFFRNEGPRFAVMLPNKRVEDV